MSGFLKSRSVQALITPDRHSQLEILLSFNLPPFFTAKNRFPTISRRYLYSILQLMYPLWPYSPDIP